MGTCLSDVEGLFRSECIGPWKFDGAPGRPGKSQKEGQEDQGTLKALGGGSTLALLPLPGPPVLPFGSSLASLELHQTTFTTGLLGVQESSFTGAVQGIAFSKNGSAELVLGDGT